ncbi:hypothetical protein [Chitinophaga sp. RAB17]|uniref:hypothetical protein n=1 Tax=Chitinophaga sp. RAB17 TaxID=3233049 RepID=UPI003F8FDEF1
MKENKYDDPAFFESYSQMPRSVDGLNAAGEWQTFRAMLPDLRNKKYWTWVVASDGIAGMRANNRRLLWWV